MTIDSAWNRNDADGGIAARTAALKAARDDAVATVVHVAPPLTVRMMVVPSPAAIATDTLPYDTHCNVVVTPLLPNAHVVPLLLL